MHGACVLRAVVCGGGAPSAITRQEPDTRTPHGIHARHESRRGAYVPALAYWMMDINNCDISRVVAGGFSRTVEGAR